MAAIFSQIPSMTYFCHSTETIHTLPFFQGKIYAFLFLQVQISNFLCLYVFVNNVNTNFLLVF